MLPLSRWERVPEGRVRGGATRRIAPHPALRATFSRREKEKIVSIANGSRRRRISTDETEPPGGSAWARSADRNPQARQQTHRAQVGSLSTWRARRSGRAPRIAARKPPAVSAEEGRKKQ